MLVWLESLSVRFQTGTTVVDMDVANVAGESIVAGLVLRGASGERRVALTRDDLLFFTNGSMTQNATLGDTHRSRR